MRKINLIAATILGAGVLCAAPISLHQSQDKALSLSVDKAQAYYGVARRHNRRVNRRAYYGGYHPYHYHGHYYRYRYGGHYYNHRRYYHHHYRYW